jgi:hypothetical protein
MIIRCLLVAVLALWGAAPVLAQTDNEAVAQAAELSERAREAITTLDALLETRRGLSAEVEELTNQLDAASEARKEEIAEALAEKTAELDEIDDQFSVLATGVSEAEFSQKDPGEFNLQAELEALVQPFVIMMRNATAEARQIEATKRALSKAEQRLATSQQALETLTAVQGQVSDGPLAEDLAQRTEIWTNRIGNSETRIAALNQQLDDLLNQRVSAGSQVQSAAKGFFRERGLSLLMGLGAFLGVFLSLKLLAGLVRRRGGKRTFYTRLTSLVFTAFTIAASFAAMMIIFNLRNDWLLLGLASLVLLAIIWIGIKMLPGLIEQVTVLLNLGAVQENERVIFNGVPFRVERLDFYTDLQNPDLDGGEFTLPVRELIGLHSRPAADDEAWFPSKKGDWVRLADENAGQVVAQTPELVVLRLLGGARVTYQTGDYLAQTPENLSNGYRVEVEFGIGYGHQADATGAIMQTMREKVHAHMEAFIGAEHIEAIAVDFLRAGASSLDYEVEVDVRGSAAERFEDIERELARVLVQIATEEGWEIPFQQVVLHRAA